MQTLDYRVRREEQKCRCLDNMSLQIFYATSVHCPTIYENLTPIELIQQGIVATEGRKLLTGGYGIYSCGNLDESAFVLVTSLHKIGENLIGANLLGQGLTTPNEEALYHRNNSMDLSLSSIRYGLKWTATKVIKELFGDETLANCHINHSITRFTESFLLVGLNSLGKFDK